MDLTNSQGILQAFDLLLHGSGRLWRFLPEPAFHFQPYHSWSRLGQYLIDCGLPGLQGIEGKDAPDAGGASQVGKMGAAGARRGLASRHLIQAVIQNDQKNIGLLIGESNEAAEVHEHAAVAIEDDDAALWM